MNPRRQSRPRRPGTLSALPLRQLKISEPRGAPGAVTSNSVRPTSSRRRGSLSPLCPSGGSNLEQDRVMRLREPRVALGRAAEAHEVTPERAPRPGPEDLLEPAAQDLVVARALGGAQEPRGPLAGQLLAQGQLLEGLLQARPGRLARRERAHHRLAQQERPAERVGLERLVLAVDQLLLALNLPHAQAKARRALQRILEELPDRDQRDHEAASLVAPREAAHGRAVHAEPRGQRRERRRRQRPAEGGQIGQRRPGGQGRAQRAAERLRHLLTPRERKRREPRRGRRSAAAAAPESRRRSPPARAP